MVNEPAQEDARYYHYLASAQVMVTNFFLNRSGEWDGGIEVSRSRPHLNGILQSLAAFRLPPS